MSKFAHMPTWLVWTLCIAILATRVNGVHLHFCFDGQKPSISVQSGVADFDTATECSSGKDQDMSLIADGLVKNITGNSLLPTLLVTAVLLFILSLPRKIGFVGCFVRPVLAHTPGYYLRPPLRGPPL